MEHHLPYEMTRVNALFHNPIQVGRYQYLIYLSSGKWSMHYFVPVLDPGGIEG